MEIDERDGDDLDSVTALGDPVRRALYRFVVAQGRDVGREEAAAATGIGRTLAAFHLDKLVEAGLLEAGFRRLTDRTGPGSGRPAKVYRRAPGERTVSLPPRDYRTMALILAEVVERLGGEEQAEAAARRAGERMAADAPPETDLPAVLSAVLARRGYEPYEEDGRIRLRNCPFHVLSEDRPLLVCSMNLALCQGLLSALDAEETAMLDPRPGECCVVFT
ncbi:helix-turn-helix transcriptional regulator [Sphaerimonospora thailandensis]|uniref:ArsR family transcriptional regulator n=1 Tax=Sphaerimonospora thailandensis TaxID=795644 RepID=A0A8J3RB20_9ACTN|nr:transcriptional regulator [Sphaerimonospora thailandensis]GIH71575.1 ArsR family transcriptional regulator [Sphaerimonospora thailandensis]